MRPAFQLVLLSMLALAVGCSTVRVSVDFDPNEDFSAYRTYAWFPRAQQETGDHRIDNPLLANRIREAVDRELAAKGYRKLTDANPDFYVAYYFSIEEKLDIYTVNRGYYDYWGYAVAIPETQVRQYEEGTLVIDVANAREKELTWRGVGKGRLSRNPTPEQTTQRVDAAVAEILKSFPPGS